MVQLVFIIIAVWLCLLILGPLVGFTDALLRAMAVAGLVGWVAALIVPGRLCRYQPARMIGRGTITNLSLLLVSCLIGALLCELILRNFYPKYQGVADPHYYHRDPILIWSRKENNRGIFRHPDTGTYHPYHHNNLGMRQHRNFSGTELESAFNIGFFGDSMVENPWVAAQYILTEPLDYLLNLGDERFNTLNFGVMGYGTGQSLLRYENFRYAENIDYVFYIFTRNDLENIYNTGLFYLGESGKLARKEALGSPWWMQFVSRLHISYLLLDISARLPMAGQGILPNVRTHIDRDTYGDIQYKPTAYQIGRDLGRGDLDSELVANVLILFQRLIHHWKDLVEANGGKFYIVLLPRLNEARLAAVLGEEFEVVNLYECFSDSHIKDYHQLEWGPASSPL